VITVRRDVRVLSGGDLGKMLTLGEVIPAIESAYLAASEQQAQLYPVIREPLASGGVFGIKSGYWPDQESLGLKVAGYWPQNRAKGLDNHQAMVVLVEPATGVPRAIIDGNFITAIRTSAAGAIGLRYLARPDSQTALIVGSGVQAEAQARALDWWQRGIEVSVFEPLDTDGQPMARAFCDRLGHSGITCQPSGPLEDAVRRADVIVTTTPARQPVIHRDWLTPGVHINAMGADTAGKREHEVATLRDSLVIVDDWTQARRLGECQHAVAAGLFTDEQHPRSIGEVIAGTAPGRTDDAQLTLFDATGLALQDLAAAELAAQTAEERDAGIIIQLD
jgi:ornithine cyclodeaminase/alanine dehydrogenase-like protein (mu-crystallin family)